MQTYGSLTDARNAKHERNDCAVCAVAISTQTEYDRVHAVLARLGRRTRGRTTTAQIKEAVSMLGHELVDVTHLVPARTVSQVPRHLISGFYMVFTPGHVLAVKDGVVEDWTVGRQHRVKKVWRVVKAGNAVPKETKFPEPKPERVLPKTTWVQPKVSVKHTIWHYADAMWSTEGKPTDVKVLAKLRIQIMDTMEKQGFKRTTMSSLLGEWQKSILKEA